MRRTHPDLPRPFRTPASPLIPLLGMVSCGYLMLNLPAFTWTALGAWMLIGLVVYFAFSRSHTPSVNANLRGFLDASCVKFGDEYNFVRCSERARPTAALRRAARPTRHTRPSNVAGDPPLSRRLPL